MKRIKKKSMNNLLLENIIKNKELLDQLTIIDNQKMGVNITKDIVISSFITNNKTYEELNNKNNILIIYDGNFETTYSILNSITKNNNVVLFPNYSYFGVNTFLIKIYNSIYSNCFLAKDKNYNKYLHTSNIFDSIYVISDKNTFLNIKKDFNGALWIAK